MHAIKITGRYTGAEFVLDTRYATPEQAQIVVDRMKQANAIAETTREVIEVES